MKITLLSKELFMPTILSWNEKKEERSTHSKPSQTNLPMKNRNIQKSMMRFFIYFFVVSREETGLKGKINTKKNSRKQVVKIIADIFFCNSKTLFSYKDVWQWQKYPFSFYI